MGLDATFNTKHLMYDVERQENGALLASVASDPASWLASWESLKQLRREYQSATLNSFSDQNPQRELLRNPGEVKRVHTLLRDIDKLEEKLRKDNREYQKLARLREVTLQDTKAALGEGQALIEYVRFRPYDIETHKLQSPHYAVFVLIGRRNQVSAVDLGEAREIEELVGRMCGQKSEMENFISKPNPDLGTIKRSERTLAVSSERLRSLIWQPVEAVLIHINRVYIATEGKLSLVPFEILAREDRQGKLSYLIEEKKEIVYVGTGRDIGRLALSSDADGDAPKTAVLVGNPAFNANTHLIAQRVAGLKVRKEMREPEITDSLSTHAMQLGGGAADRKLPRNWSEDEGPALETLVSGPGQKLSSLGWQVVPLIRGDAVEEAVENLESPTILQIATHGLFLPAPIGVKPEWQNPLLRSMLVLAGANTWRPEASLFYRVDDKILTEAEAKDYKLTPEQLVKARLEISNGYLTAYEVARMDLRRTQMV